MFSIVHAGSFAQALDLQALADAIASAACDPRFAQLRSQALYEAARDADPQRLSLLLGEGSLHGDSLTGQDPLWAAARAGSLSCVELLLQTGPKTSPPRLSKALLAAVVARSLPCVGALVGAGATPSRPAGSQAGALHWAVCLGEPDLVEILAPWAQFDLNPDGASAFCLAASRAQWDCAQILAPYSNLRARALWGDFKGLDAFDLARMFHGEEGLSRLNQAVAESQKKTLRQACQPAPSARPARL